MKKIILIPVSLIVMITTSFGQLEIYDNYEISFDNQSGLEHLFIDTLSNPDNIWQTGQPEKTVFTIGHSEPDVIITDRINSYPTNDTSAFIITNVSYGGGFDLPHTVILSGWYYVNTDTLTDFGMIEFSPDNGTTWIDLLNDTVQLSDYLYWYWRDKPVLSGNSNQWTSFWVNLAELGHFYGVQNGDTVMYKFTFISDSIQTNKDGLMFDDFYLVDFNEGIAEPGFEFLKSTCFPNPAGNKISITFENNDNTPFEIEVYDFKGVQVIYNRIINSDKIELNISRLNSGIYYYKLKNTKKKIFSIGKFLKE